MTTPKGARNGIMVMHNGDRRHGIDIPLLRKLMPDNLVFRVGEAHLTIMHSLTRKVTKVLKEA